MTIKNIDSTDSIYPLKRGEELEKKYAQEKSAEQMQKANIQRADKLELSREAQKLGPIKEKIDGGFYENPEIMRQTAFKIAQQIGKEDQGET